jgi:hypothetical protein
MSPGVLGRRRPSRGACYRAAHATTFRNDAHSYNADNQITGPATYVYDGNGNPTTFGGTSRWNWRQTT